MTGPNFMDEIDCGSFFDHIDDLLDFPGGEDIDAGVMPLGKSSDSLPSIWSSAQSESLHGSDSVFSSTNGSDLSTELSVPYEEIVQLEWLSTFVEDSFSGGSLTMSKEDATNANNGSSIDDNNKNSDNKVLSSSSPRQFQTSSPVSVLESSSSCSGDKPVPLSPEEAINPAARCGRARSKRPRPAAFDPRPAMQVISSPESSVPENEAYPENHAESYPLIIKVPNMPQTNIEVKKKKKKIKFTMHSSSAMAEVDPNAPPQQPVRKCLHCEITKTPQWRAGPMGPKTLCNACGVRYKSGRLFPEYRPAASPTFVPALHSNSHKKVLEMRSRTVEHAAAIEGIAPIESDPAPELIPNMSHRLEYM